MNSTAALTALNYSQIGAKLFAITNMGLAASASWTQGFSSVLQLLNMVGLVLSFGGLLFAAVMFMMGQTERVLYGVVGAVIGGLAWVITKTMFETGSGTTVNIDMQNATGGTAGTGG